MYRLAVETANSSCSVALIHGNEIIDFIIDETPSQQSKMLFTLLNTILESNKLTYDNIEAIGVAVGPGSFTGIRIGVAGCVGVNIAKNIPLIGITNLQAALAGSLDKNTIKPVAVILDASRGYIYTELYSNELKSIKEPEMLKIEEFADYINNENVFLCGSGSLLVKGQYDNLNNKVTTAEDVAKALLLIGKKVLKPYPCVPLYIREPDVTLSKKK
ncbi:MAG: tRNA (adenosine(37)-N6)-threonylcarbamoyltransferase complex dimerization subunit type 1 TsaB [Sphingobacteriia bacterium]|nr:tRNA (adenosine(37)-N6)-threonylcarbamoyltransferase complex dimerization subunit type 1 TsaB [Sphingobacteriia bacterium]